MPATGKMLPVENEDIALALVQFASGVGGSFEISRVATGFKCGLDLHGVRHAGQPVLRPGTHERAAPLQRARIRPAAAASARSSRGPSTPTTRFFCPAPGHGLGINDLKVIEARNLIRAIADGSDARPGFDVGLAGPAGHGSDGALARERRVDAGRRALIRERHMSTVITQHRKGFAPGFTPITIARRSRRRYRHLDGRAAARGRRAGTP